MVAGFDPDWSAVVCGRLDALFASTGAGFSRSLPQQVLSGSVGDMLWEADAEQFAKRYPDSGVVEAYGPQWPAMCIDYWVYMDTESRRATLSTEGWSAGTSEIDLTGNGAEDAERIGAILASILRVEM